MTKITQEFAYGSNHIIKAEIVPKKTITVFYEHKVGTVVSGVEFDIGDTAIYDSFNLKYLGKIVSITEKTVTIAPRWGGKNTRLKIENFCWRNKGFNLEEVMAENAETSMCI